MKAPVNKIIPFSSVDGPGNRTAVFLQGCNFNCLYCHNPETINFCRNCMKCVPLCPAGALSVHEGRVVYDFDKCVNCDTCISVCPYNSSPKIRMMEPQEVFDEIKKHMPFIRGVTVSGGECTLHPQFLTELFTLCKQSGLHTLLDSNGSIPYAGLPELMAVTDGVMLDIKAFDEGEHLHATGINNRIVKDNAVFLAEQGLLYEVRTVIVPELFNPEQTVTNIAKMLSPYLVINDIQYKLIAYRPMGVRREYRAFTSPSAAYLQGLAELIKYEGFINIIII